MKLGLSLEQEKEITDLIKRDIMGIALIYPSAFDLYDEPLDRLTHRVISTIDEYLISK